MEDDVDHSHVTSDPRRLVAIDYASPKTQQRWTFRMVISPAVIAVLAVIYALACRPAYWQSSWPPLDRLSQGWSWVWVPAAAIFLLLVPRSRWAVLWLIVLAVITGSIQAWTYPFGTMNPVLRWDWGMWIANLIVALPIHLIATGVVAGLCWGLLALFDIQPVLYGDHRSWRSRLVPIVLVVFCIAAVPLIAHGYAIINDRRDAAEGAAWADRDWASQEPALWSRSIPMYRNCGDLTFDCGIDPDLNIPIRRAWYKRSEPGYNAESRRLLAHDKPAWLAKFPRIADQDMIRMQHSNDMKAIAAYPYTLSANAVVIRGDATLPWGGSIGTGSESALVETKYDFNELFEPLDTRQPVLVGQLSKYPGVHFIRNGTTVIACSDDGWILEILTAP
jgi:hypothetical protein